MPPLETVDLIGWDTHRAVMETIYSNTEDETHSTLAVPPYMHARIAAGALGNKTPDKGGFYKRVKDKRLVLDLASGEYVEPRQLKVPAIEEARGLIRYGDYREALRTLLVSHEPEAAVVRCWLLGYISYAGTRNGKVSDRRGIDRVMGWGFNWATPDALVGVNGPEKTTALLVQEGLPVPPHLSSWRSGELHVEHDDVGRYFVAR